MKYYRKKDHGINLTQIGVANVLRYSLKLNVAKSEKVQRWDNFRGSFGGDYSTCQF